MDLFRLDEAILGLGIRCQSIDKHRLFVIGYNMVKDRVRGNSVRVRVRVRDRVTVMIVMTLIMKMRTTMGNQDQH
jgi:hypothetical protein